MKDENDTEIDMDIEPNGFKPEGCMMLIVSLIFWWVIISHFIMRFQNPWMTETQLFLNLPKAFVLDEPTWGITR